MRKQTKRRTGDDGAPSRSTSAIRTLETHGKLVVRGVERQIVLIIISISGLVTAWRIDPQRQQEIQIQKSELATSFCCGVCKYRRKHAHPARAQSALTHGNAYRRSKSMPILGASPRPDTLACRHTKYCTFWSLPENQQRNTTRLSHNAPNDVLEGTRSVTKSMPNATLSIVP